MSDYKAPTADIQFLLNDVFAVPELWEKLDGLEDVDSDVADAILQEVGKIAEEGGGFRLVDHAGTV